MHAPAILIVEDDAALLRGLKDNFEAQNYRVETARDGQAGLAAALVRPPNLLLLDIMLPKMNGFEICRAVRARKLDMPIIMLTAKGQEEDVIRGLELGADDYVTKPFSPRELVARVAARLRRRPSAEPEDDSAAEVLRYGPITIDAASHTVTVDGQEVKLTAKEFLLLQYFVRHRGRVLSRDLLLTDVWGYQYTGGTRTVDVHIRRLREKMPVLNDAIETVKQFGYKLV
jgi:two-component system alkaline phosphatase synthesis response regulator PhoP